MLVGAFLTAITASLRSILAMCLCGERKALGCMGSLRTILHKEKPRQWTGFPCSHCAD